jgi:hypothetical protein
MIERNLSALRDCGPALSPKALLYRRVRFHNACSMPTTPHQSRCWRLTANLGRCARRGDWRLFCADHRRQWLLWLSFFVFTAVAGSLQIYSALFRAAAPGRPSPHSRFHALLFASCNELRANEEFLLDLRSMLQKPKSHFPLGRVATERTVALFEKYYNELVKDAYGEEKNLYQLVVKLDRVVPTLNSILPRPLGNRRNSMH